MTGQSIWLQLCAVMVVLQLSMSINLYRKLIKAGSGSHYALAWQGHQQPKDSLGARFMARVEPLARRDYYVFAWMVLAIVGWLKLGIVLMAATTLCIAAHELLRPRQVREEFLSLPPS